MRKVYLLTGFMLAVLFAGAQIAPSGTLSGSSSPQFQYQYGNSWYDPAQTYYKLLVDRDAIYRVTASDLVNSGVDTSGLVPENLHIIYRGEEQPLYVRNNGSALGYFEFWGRLNDGRVDSLMYRNIEDHHFLPDGVTNVHRSIFTDTSAYFIYWDNQAGLRYTEFADTVNYGSFSPEPWFRYESLRDYPSTPYQQGSASPMDPKSYLNSEYVPGEGYSGPGFDETGAWEEGFYPTTGFVSTGNPSVFQARLYAYTSADTHVRSIKLNNIEVFRDTVNSQDIRTVTFQTTANLAPWIFLKFNTLVSTPSNHTDRVAWFTLRYDRDFNLAGLNAMKALEYSKAADAYMHFTAAGGGTECVMYDLSTQTRIAGTVSGSDCRFIVPGSTTSNRTLVMATDPGILTPVIRHSNLRNLSSLLQGADFILITDTSLAPSALDYVNYRDTCTVNEMTAMLVYTDEIFDEFGYGSHTPLAIQRFCKFALHEWQQKAKYFMLWGRARGYHRGVTGDIVPTWSLPASDAMFVSDFYPEQVKMIPEAPIGRLAILSNQDGWNYLDKVDQYEHTPPNTWTKETLLLAGGRSNNEQYVIGDAMADSSGSYRYYMEQPPFSGHVNWFRKYQDAPISSTELSPTEIINNGVSLIHFFGHSSQSAFELDIKEPNEYSNWGKYPFMLAFGCYGGDFTTPFSSFGELFILEKDRGCIGYLANSSLGLIAYLKMYGDKFYPVQFGTHYGKPIGDVIKETVRLFSNNGQVSLDDHHLNHARQLNLQGDPAVVLRFPQKPDLQIETSDIYLSPSNVSAQDNQFTVNVTAHNYGSMPVDSFSISVRHLTPAGNTLVYPSEKFPPLAFYDTLSLTFLNQLGPAFAGQNEFEVFIDTGDVVDELLEDNNLATLRVIIPGNSPAILFPAEFAIVPNSTVDLAAASYILTTDPSQSYVFEIGTDPEFTGATSSGPVNGTSVFSSWQVPFTLTDSAVYYWRVRLENVWPPVWTTSSFRYINGLTGWTQAQAPQFPKDPAQYLRINLVNREWEFLNLEKEIHASVDMYGTPEYKMGTYESQLSFGPDGMMYTPISMDYISPAIENTLYGDWTLSVFPDGQTDLVTSINNTPPGDWFMACSNSNISPPGWDSLTINAFERIGVPTETLTQLPPGNRLIVLGQKGSSGGALTITAPNQVTSSGAPLYDLRYTLSTPRSEGTLTSTLVGPATSWGSVRFAWSPAESLPSDSIVVSVYGVKADKSEVLLLTGLQEGIHQIDTIDAAIYPFLRLEGTFSDRLYRTAPQLKEWTVLFSPAPDAALDPTVNYAFHNDTVQEGELVSISMSVRNLTSVPMDSVLVRFMVERADRSQLILDSIRTAPLAGSAVIPFDYSFNTALKNLDGEITFVVEINPGPEQPELYAFNNIFYRRFRVERDKVNPLLDVTFNGKRIMEGDIVSSNPEIRIEVNDENAFLPVVVNDTTFEIYFGPGRSFSQLQRVNTRGNPLVEIIPLKMSENKAGIVFRPGNLADGEYTLKVKGRDFSENLSGSSDYEVHFTVVNEKAVSRVLNYPNPFSSSTRFVYTLTGDELPEMFEIRIFTISGKLVKVIDLAAEGDVHFGYNISQYTWDGRDDYGDLLANGVYIYQAVTRFSSRDEIKVRDEGIDKYFNNGFGKLYILR